MSSVEQKIVAARSIALEQEARDAQTAALFRKMLGEIEDDVRALRVEVAKANVEFFSEKQFAQRVGVGQKTIERMRKARKITPCNVGGPIRYSTLHVLMLAKPGETTGDRRPATGNVRQMEPRRRQG